MARLGTFVQLYRVTSRDHARTGVLFVLPRLGLWLCVVGYAVALATAYGLVVAPIFGYLGYEFAPDPLRTLEAFVLLTAMTAVVPARFTRPSDLLLAFLVGIVIVPHFVYYAASSAPRLNFYVMLMGMLAVVAGARLPIVGIRRWFRHGHRYALWGSAAVTALVLSLLLRDVGFGRFSLDFSTVYAFRGDYNEQFRGPSAYLISWTYKVFAPTLLAYSLLRRSWWLAFAVMSAFVLFFGLSSHKSTLFFPVVVLGVFMIRSVLAPSLVIVGLGLVASLGTLSYVALGSSTIADLLVRRVLLTPAKLDFEYHAFADANGYVYWSNSVLSAFLTYPFETNYARMISFWQYGHFETWANTGFLGTGYLHFGPAGVFAFGVVLGVLVRVVDGLWSNAYPAWFAVAVVAVPFYLAFASADLTTALLTHGLAPALVVLALIRSLAFGLHRRARVG